MRSDQCGSRRRVLCGPTCAALCEGFYAVRPVRPYVKGSMRSDQCGSMRRVLCGPICAALGERFYAARPMRLCSACTYLPPHLNSYFKALHPIYGTFANIIATDETRKNAGSHLGLYCSLTGISSKNEIKNEKLILRPLKSQLTHSSDKEGKVSSQMG